jgi:hypothetical protein
LKERTMTEDEYQNQLPGVEAAVNAARTRVLVAKQKLQLKRRASAAAIVAWNALTPQPTQREMIAAVAATQKARDDYAASQVSKPKYQIDAVMGRRHRPTGRGDIHVRQVRGLKA